MVIITVIIMVIITVIMVLCLGISLQGRKMSESQTGRQVRLSSLIPADAEQLIFGIVQHSAARAAKVPII